jgi:hypothetical protein
MLIEYFQDTKVGSKNVCLGQNLNISTLFGRTGKRLSKKYKFLTKKSKKKYKVFSKEVILDIQNEQQIGRDDSPSGAGYCRD